MSHENGGAHGRPGSALLIRELLNRVRTWAPERTITYRDRLVLTYREWLDRVDRLGGWLTALEVGPGDRVGVMDYDSHRYLELFFAVPMLGAAIHTVNVRLTPDQTGYTIAHAQDTVLFVHVDFLPLLQAMGGHLAGVRHVIVLTEGEWVAPADLPCAGEYEEGLARAKPVATWPDLSEDAMATLFYTTGTTGEPKGVSFSHRQIVLHTLAAGLTLAVHADPVDFRSDDVYMPLTPMFHVHAWGMPYLATMLGATQVYPGKYEPQMLIQLLANNRVTFSHCVPTLLQMLLHHPASGTVDWRRLKVVIGGAALLPALAREAQSHGIRIVGGYGMSETCPIVAISHIRPSMTDGTEDERIGLVSRTGFALPLVQTSIMDGQGRPVEPGKVGELVLRAPWLTPGYVGDEASSDRLWRNGWLHTGDGAYVDADGYLRITDRLKDVIKIGGEWISSLEIESALARHPAVREVAVIGVPDAKWDEHPRAEVVLRDGMSEVTARELSRHLHAVIESGVIHKRAILTVVVIVAVIPKTSVGKVDKKRMRAASAGPNPDAEKR